MLSVAVADGGVKRKLTSQHLGTNIARCDFLVRVLLQIVTVVVTNANCCSGATILPANPDDDDEWVVVVKRAHKKGATLYSRVFL